MWLQYVPKNTGNISPFETLPGEQAQADWGHFGTIVVDGATYKLYAFVFTLCWSRVSYVEFVVGTPAWTAEPKETKGCCQETIKTETEIDLSFFIWWRRGDTWLHRFPCGADYIFTR